MKDIRQGNDIRISWSIFKKGGQIFSLDGKKISLYLKSVFGRKELNDFVITGNIIQWTFYGKDQKSTGKYSLELVVNEGEKGMITTDTCDFVNLVSCSCKLQGGEDAPNVETESIELTSTLEYVSGGGDYDDTALWKALGNKVDKVEGKGLSSNDFTNALKEKLEGLENYDDAEISSAVEKLSRDFNALLGNNASAAIESFNEIIAFLEGIEDSASLDAIVASIQQEIAKVSNGLADTDAKLTELSERIDNLPTAESSVFKAEYGVTTYEEVSEAYNQGKIIHCDYESRCYELALFTGNIAWFSCVNTTTSYLLMLNADSSWSKASYGLENTGNRVDTIQADAKPYQYPSAKAVYDALQNVGGGSSVFKAIYGVTTFEEIKAAYDSGKVVHCDYKTYCYVLSRILDVAAYFDAMSAPNSYRITCGTDGWTENTYQIELKTNKTTTLSPASTDTQYPSAKAVYEALQNLPQGGGSSVFEAVYNETTYDEIVEAYKAGKHCLCVKDDLIYNIVTFNEGGDLLFTCIRQVYAYTVTCTASGLWHSSLYTIEKTANKTKAINAESTDTQYPSAKAVYDFVNNTLGTIINGDY